MQRNKRNYTSERVVSATTSASSVDPAISRYKQFLHQSKWRQTNVGVVSDVATIGDKMCWKLKYSKRG